MNRTYRTVWNASLGAWVATSEAARRSHKSGVRSALSLAAVVPLLAAMGTAQAACSTIGSTVTCTGFPGLPLFLNSYTSSTNNLTVNVNAGTQMNATMGGKVITLGGTGLTLNNSGNIDPSYLGQVPILSGGVSMGTGVSTTYSITNLASGTLRGTGGGQGMTLTSLDGLALHVNNGATGFTSIVNRGTVNTVALSSSTVIASDALIVGVRGGGEVSMTNFATGVLTGRTAFEASAAGNTFTNFGTINGGVSMGAGSGANTFMAVTASSVSAAGGSGQALGGLSGVNLTFAATGQIDGGAGGANLLMLRNTADDHTSTGSGTASSATYVNFADLMLQGGTWALQGPLVSGSTTLNGGLALFSDPAAFGTGMLTSSGGAVQATANDLTVSNLVSLGAGGLTVQGAHSMSLTGAMSGAGGLTKSGTGTLTLSGANSYSGGTTITAGTLQGNTTSLTGNIANDAQLVFDQAATGTYAAVLSGGGAMSKTGGGNLILTGVNTFSGATRVEGGTLSVNGSLAGSAITVQSGGALGGSGVVGTTTLAAGAALAPGNSIGTLSVAGNLNFAPSSVYRVEVDADGHNDRTNVTGTAALNGAVAVEAAAGTYAASTSYTILNAAGGITGTFSSVTSDLAFLTPSLTYDANNVLLNLARNDVSFSAVALTPNQAATSAALESAGAGATGDMATVQSALTVLSAEQARAAYDSVGGSGLVALRGAGAVFSAGFGNLLQTRMGAVQGGNARGEATAFSNRPLLLAANGHMPALMEFVSDSPQQFALSEGALLPSASTSRGLGFWLRGSGGYQNTDADGNATASKVRNTSLSTGFDTQLDEGLVVGAALSSGSSRLGFDSTADSGKSRGTALAVYGSYEAGPWAFKGASSAAWNSNHMDRTVAVGALVRQASSDFDSNTLSAYGEAMYSIPMTGWTLRPVAALSVSRDKVDGFSEIGAGALSLHVAGQTIQSTKSLLGAQASFEAGRVRLEPRAIWAHEHGDINRPMTAQFQGAAAASPFQVSGVALERDTLILGLGVSGNLRRGTELFADVQVEHNSRQFNAGVLVGLRASW